MTDKHSMSKSKPPFGNFKTCQELGQIIRIFRKSQGLTLENVANICNVGIRFLSELERGKETAELGKTLMIIHNLGIVLSAHPRAASQEEK